MILYWRLRIRCPLDGAREAGRRRQVSCSAPMQGKNLCHLETQNEACDRGYAPARLRCQPDQVPGIMSSG